MSTRAAVPMGRALPGARVTLIITLLLASGATQRAISIDSDQVPATKSEINPTPTAPSYATAPAQAQPAATTTMQPPPTKVPPATSPSAPSNKRAAGQQQQQQQQAGRQQTGRVRRPTQAAATSPTQTRGLVNHGLGADSPATDPLQDEIKRLMAEYSNTPPLFVTTTRDFFVDVARYPLGSKLTTIQALDSEGDRIEYSLMPANGRDASPYFAINATSGELRLANRRIPLQPEPGELPAVREDDEAVSEGDEEEEEGEEGGGGARRQPTGALGKPGSLYSLNVAANDGKYTSIVELQIHVVNSSSFGTKSPVQLTIEGGRHGSESALSARTNEFFDQLYRPLESQTRGANSSALVFPSFVNPGLTAPGRIPDEDLAAPLTTIATPPLPLAGNELDRMEGGAEPRPLNLSVPFVVEPAAPRRLEAAMQQPMVLSLIITICSCFVVALVLLVFVLPLSVKRLKKRLKKMELQHEQLSQHTSTGRPSIVCSSANSTHSGSSLATSAGAHLPSSLSQFTLSGSDRSCAGQLSPHPLGHNHHQQHLNHHLDHHLDHHQRRHPLDRQSSLDSAIASGVANFAAGSSLSYQTQSYQPTQLGADLSPQRAPTSALNRLNNGAIVNPIYLHGQSAMAAHQASELGNIYCPIDDDFYSTINNEPDAAPNGMIVGQTCESRNYFASQCAPSLQLQPVQLQQGPCDSQQHSPLSRSSSRSSTRSLSRFLSLPSRHWAQQEQQQLPSKRKCSNLDELEYHFSSATLQHARQPAPASQEARTIARADHISQEQQVRVAGRRGTRQAEEHVWELERHWLKFLDILDEGQFGLVWRCRLRKPAAVGAEPAEERTVAVKTLKSFAAKDEREREELLAEIEIMKRVCEHPNVVRILHCCTRDISPSRPILLVMEHVELGKLKSFLERSRATRDYATASSLYNHTSQGSVGLEYLGVGQVQEERPAEPTSYEGATGDATQAARRRGQLSSRDLITFIYHVAKGMEYISSQRIVHRDLASRNILISAQRVCKIGDFGMARHTASPSDVYERRSRNAKIPVRWMAPEVLLHNLFTTKSDVYSFGILLWEIVTLGSTPYAHLKMEQIVEAVARRGERPGKPDYCHAQLYSIMASCWAAEPETRPSFAELVRQLDQLLLGTDEYILLDQYSDHNYYNVAAAPGELV